MQTRKYCGNCGYEVGENVICTHCSQPLYSKDSAPPAIHCTDGLGLVEACRLVENVARSLGKDCQIIFTDTVVSVAPLSWAGDSTGKTLYEALADARKSTES